MSLLALFLTACVAAPAADSGAALDLAACDCSDAEMYPPEPCTPVDPLNCTDCDCDGYAGGDDCNDSNPSIHPGAPEWSDCDDSSADIHGGPDGVDNDCDGVVDEDAEPPLEECNGVDDNCDGAVDEGVGTPYYVDIDGDGYGEPGSAVLLCESAEGYSPEGGDCDDAEAAISPAAPEVPGNGLDDDCDGVIDES